VAGVLTRLARDGGLERAAARVVHDRVLPGAAVGHRILRLAARAALARELEVRRLALDAVALRLQRFEQAVQKVLRVVGRRELLASPSESSSRHPERALSVTQRALLVTQRELSSSTQRALSPSTSNPPHLRVVLRPAGEAPVPRADAVEEGARRDHGWRGSARDGERGGERHREGDPPASRAAPRRRSAGRCS
jgi:hypothetical protein